MSSGEKMMEGGLRAWARVGDLLRRRPFQFVFTLIASIALILALTFSVATSSKNTADIEEIQQAFCAGNVAYDEQQRKNCQELLTQLLREPTPEQARRLREIIEDAP